jgi:putative DNA methylase
MNRYDRRLPHINAIGARTFVTFRLHGSLPVNRVFPPSTLTHGEAFAAMDRLLDNPKAGPTFLSQPKIAAMVVQSILEGETRFHRYELHAFVVMPNHVHLLVISHVPLSKWLRSLKGYTGHEALRILNQPGKPFWQDESYDHIVRDDKEFSNIRHYIEWNPVRAGFVATPEDFPWSSAKAAHQCVIA